MAKTSKLYTIMLSEMQPPAMFKLYEKTQSTYCYSQRYRDI